MDRKLALRRARTIAVVVTEFLFSLSPAAFAQGRVLHASETAAERPSTRVPAGQAKGPPQEVLEVVRWLPEDTESILLARGPLQDGILRDFRDPLPPQMSPAIVGTPGTGKATAPDPIQQPPPDFQQESLAAFAGLFGLSGKAFVRNITDHEVRFVVAAARGFGAPVIGGASTCGGVQVIVFREAVPDVGVQAKSQERLSLVQIERNNVVRLDTQEKWGEKDERVTIYYAKPKRSVLIAATDANFLKTMLQRIAQPPVSRTPLLDFPEWKHVDAQAPVWGVRHRRTATPIYILAKPEKDGLPFSELSGISFSYRPGPATCLAYQFHFPEKAHDAVQRAITRSKQTKLIAPSVVENTMRIRARAPLPARTYPAGAQTGASEPGSGTPGEATFMVQHLMGYVVCP